MTEDPKAIRAAAMQWAIEYYKGNGLYRPQDLIAAASEFYHFIEDGKVPQAEKVGD